MSLLLSASASLLLPSKTLISPLNNSSIILQINSKPFSLKPTSQKPPPPPITASLSSTATTITKTPQSLSNWSEFSKRASGEWDGFGADFTSTGSPVELPENVVPEAYREWEVQVFDWQTQCPTLASDSEDPTISYKLIKLLPTVGCEADAATRYSVDERIAGGEKNDVLGLGYDANGCFVAVWEVKGLLEVEHCLVDPKNGEVRVRVVMVVKAEEGMMELKGIRVFSEQWYGPWRNGEQMGGCAIRESGFALSERVRVENVVGVWERRSLGVARFGTEGPDVLHQLNKDKPHVSVRDEAGLVALPKNLWCSLKEREDGETWGEVGWLLDHGIAMSSKCVFLKDGTLKEMAIGQETAVLGDT